MILRKRSYLAFSKGHAQKALWRIWLMVDCKRSLYAYVELSKWLKLRVANTAGAGSSEIFSPFHLLIWYPPFPATLLLTHSPLHVCVLLASTFCSPTPPPPPHPLSRPLSLSNHSGSIFHIAFSFCVSILHLFSATRSLPPSLSPTVVCSAYWKCRSRQLRRLAVQCVCII